MRTLFNVLIQKLKYNFQTILPIFLVIQQIEQISKILFGFSCIHFLSSFAIILAHIIRRPLLYLPWLLTQLVTIMIFLLTFLCWTFLSVFADLLATILFPLVWGVVIGVMVCQWKQVFNIQMKTTFQNKENEKLRRKNH